MKWHVASAAGAVGVGEGAAATDGVGVLTAVGCAEKGTVVGTRELAVAVTAAEGEGNTDEEGAVEAGVGDPNVQAARRSGVTDKTPSRRGATSRGMGRWKLRLVRLRRSQPLVAETTHDKIAATINRGSRPPRIGTSLPPRAPGSDQGKISPIGYALDLPQDQEH